MTRHRNPSPSYHSKLLKVLKIFLHAFCTDVVLGEWNGQ
jgi:hypothetical protein